MAATLLGRCSSPPVHTYTDNQWGTPVYIFCGVWKPATRFASMFVFRSTWNWEIDRVGRPRSFTQMSGGDWAANTHLKPFDTFNRRTCQYWPLQASVLYSLPTNILPNISHYCDLSNTSPLVLNRRRRVALLSTRLGEFINNGASMCLWCEVDHSVTVISS